MLWANLAKGRSSAQLSCWKLQNTHRNCLISWLMCLVSPSVWGWKVVEREPFTSSLFQSSLIILAANWGPRSEITCVGKPVLCQTLLRYNSDVCSTVISFLQGAMTTALLKRSTVTNIES